MEIQKPERPLIDRPRYVSKPPNVVNVKPNNNKTVNKKNQNKRQQKRKVVNKKMLEQQMQQPVSGSANLYSEDIKNKPLSVKSKPHSKRKTKKLSKPPRRIEKSKKDTGSGMFKQMKDKFIGKSKDEDTNKDN